MSDFTLITPCVGCGENIVVRGTAAEGVTQLIAHECRWCGERQSVTVGQRKVRRTRKAKVAANA